MKKKLLLFDIDGTVLTSGGAGERALRRGFRERFGIDDDLTKVEIAGRTDSGIARRMLAAHGLEQSPENITAFVDAYLSFLPQELPAATNGTLLPGVLTLLETLKTREDVVLALLTGNVERGAKLKLSHYGVWHFFEFGAYADDHHDRNELGHFAKKRALERRGIEFPPEDIYVLGDTPHDVACARVIGAKAIAVATGKFTAPELAATQPDFLFENFSDLPKVLALFD